MTRPNRHYVKTALSVLNMGFVRGLSAGYMKGTPAINDWVADLIANDSVLKQTGVSVLRERAAIGYHNRYYERAAVKGSPYLKMLAALWRESPVPSLGPGERLATMASLLHVDRFGDSLVAVHIGRSGLSPAAWVRRYLDAYLMPLLHCFYAHSLVFTPHGENVILVLDDAGVPQRVVLKDIGEEIGVMNDDRVPPAEVERVRASGARRPEDACRSSPTCSCLNRLQLRDNQKMVDFDNPDVGSELQFAGSLPNPIAGSSESYSWSSTRATRPATL